jgi:hypothetical protein
VTQAGRLLGKLWSQLFPPDPAFRDAPDRSIYERFAIPFAFKPRLSVLEATVAAIATFFRIVLGCLLFAIWGTYTLLVWFDIPNLFWRVAILLPLLAVFLLALALLMLAITALAKVFIPAKTSQV